jgi:hypothetical protein
MKNMRIAFARFFSIRLFAALFCALAYLSPAQAVSVLPLYLEELIDNSAVAFEGKCTGNRTERDAASNMVVTYTTFEVREVLKGSVGSTHEIKQIGGSLPDEKLEYRVQGIPTFTVGEDYVVFLAGTSSAGFSSPIGLSQGRFGIEAGATGRKVSNGRDFKDMTARMSARVPETSKAKLQKDAGPVREMDLDDFKQMVRNHVGAGK